MIRALLRIRKNVAHYLPFYHEYNTYLFNRRYQRGLAPWCEISDGLCSWLSKLRGDAVVLAPEGRILDIGCGDGAMTAKLSRDSREVIGLDISIEAIKRAREYENKNLTFYVHNLERDPLMGKIALSFAKTCSTYVPFISMKKVVRKLSEALIREGILFVIDYLPKDMETRYNYQLLSQFLASIRIEPVTYEQENARFMMALYRKL